MKIETKQVTRLLISDLMREPFKLDPVTVYLEDLGLQEDTDRISRRGKIIIECYGKLWSAYWGAMGDRTLSQFVCGESDQYLIGCLAPQLHESKFSGSALAQMARKAVLDCRRGKTAKHFMYSLDKEDAARLWSEIEDLEGIEHESDCWSYNELLTKLFGDEWFHTAQDATEPNRDYEYLQRIVAAVQAALRTEEAKGSES